MEGKVMGERLTPVNEVTARRMLLPEVVREYLHFTDLVSSPFVEPDQKARWNVERLGILEVMKVEEKIELAEYGDWVFKRIQKANGKP